MRTRNSRVRSLRLHSSILLLSMYRLNILNTGEDKARGEKTNWLLNFYRDSGV